LAVADNGIGIAEQDLPKLGNPFVQADNAYNRSHDGAGLGLSVVKGFARLHRGRLELASKLGQGTTAIVTLPLAYPQAESDEGSASNPAVSAA
jgi:cell cycle sensor histidine kinase DivJ